MEALRIRRERPDDAPAIEQLLQAAFDGPLEARIVAALRRSGAPWISLVAECDGDIVGQLVLSAVSIPVVGDSDARVAGLGPMAVRPDRQNQRIGSQLIEAALAQGWVEQFDAIVVLGHPNYYPRFGFQPASRYQLESTWDVPDEAFMALELKPGALDACAGPVRYHPAFDAAL